MKQGEEWEVESGNEKKKEKRAWRRGKERASLLEKNYRKMEGLGKQSLSCSGTPGWAWARCFLEFILSGPGTSQACSSSWRSWGAGGVTEEFWSH